MQASPVTTVDRAARDLLSELDCSKKATYTSSSNDPSESEDLSSLDPALSVLFICQGLAGLVVKKVSRLNVICSCSSFS